MLGMKYQLGGKRFNGAVTFWLRKFSHRMQDRREMDKLQWGRNFLVTEISCKQRPVLVVSLPLQWGRNFLVTEIS